MDQQYIACSRTGRLSSWSLPEALKMTTSSSSFFDLGNRGTLRAPQRRATRAVKIKVGLQEALGAFD